MRLLSTLLIVQFTLASAFAQKAALRSASRIEMPALADCNSPAFWRDREIHVFNSAGVPMGSTGPDQFHLGPATAAGLDTPKDYSVWIESTWQDPDGNIFAWYHHEPGGLCGGKLTAPQIGALVSSDGGRTFRNLGIVLESGDPIDCTAANGFFGSGHGDFSVIADRDAKYLYFLFGNYGGSLAGQGVAIARMAVDNRWDPAGAVWKYFEGAWTEPGRGGRVSPIFPAAVSWQRPDTNAFWGPSIHWNTYLERYVILLNHSCCRPRWPQEGIYVSFNPDIADPAGWSTPEKIMSRPPDYYPQVMGLEEGGADTVAGQIARFYIHGRSSWEIVFSWPAPDPPPQPEAQAVEPAPPPAAAKTPEPVLVSIGSPAEYLLTVEAAPPEGGTVTVTPPAEKRYYPQGSSVQIVATPNAGYRFLNWSGTLSGEVNPQLAVLNAPLDVTANFAPLPAELSVTVAHEGDFWQGQAGATYLLTVSNRPGAGDTRGAITVTEALPAGLRLASMEGTGWACAENACSRSDVLPGGTAFPPITVKVNVEDTAGSPLVNRVSVTGGGSPAANGADAANVAPRRVPSP